MIRFTAIRCSFWLALAVAGLTAAPARGNPADDQYAVAAGHYAQARWGMAVTEFQTFVKEYPRHELVGKAIFFQGEAQVQLGHYAEGLALFQDFLQREPRAPLARQALFRSGETAYFANKAQPAQQALEQFSKNYPDDKLNVYVWAYLGDLALLGGDAAGAEKYYTRQLDRFATGPMRDECRLGLARSLQAQGKRPEAIAALDELAKNPKSPLAADAQLYRASLQYAAADYPAALAGCERFESDFHDHPRFAQARLLHGQTLYQLARFDDAHKILESLSADDKLAIDAQLWIGLTLKAQEKWAEAAKTLQAAADAHPDHPLAATLRFHAGEALLRAGQFDAASKQLAPTGGVPASDAAEPATRKYLAALALQGQQHHTEALAILDRLAADQTDGALGADVLTARAVSLAALARGDEAIPALADYLQKHGEEKTAAAPAGELAVAYARAKQLDKAHKTFAQFQKLATDAPRRQATTQRLAEAAYRAGDFVWSKELFAGLTDGQEKGQKTETTFDTLNGLGWSQFRQGDFPAAAETFAKLMERDPADPRSIDAAWMRGQALEQAGKLDGALAVYGELAEKHADSKQAPQALLAAARIHARMQQHAEAAAAYERFAAKYANSPEMDAALLGWGWTLSDLDRPADAKQRFEQLRQQFPKSPYWSDATFRLAEMALAAKDFVAAEKLDDELLAVKPLDDAKTDLTERALYLKGQIAAAGEHWDRVAAPLSLLSSRYPKSSLRLAADYWIAEAAYRQGKYEDAGLLFETLARQAAGGRDGWLAMIPLRQAQVLAQGHHWDEARAIAEKIAADFPSFSQQYEADYLVGRCWAGTAEFDKARQAYGQVLRSATGGKSETAAMAQWMIGESYFHQRNYDAAIREYLRLEILYPYPHWQAGGLLQAGKCHEALGQWKSATELYARLLKNYPKTDFTEEAAHHLQTAQQHLGETQRK